MTIKGWRQAAVVVAVAAASMTLTSAASAAERAPERTAAQQGPAIEQKLPPGFRIEGDALYNAAGQKVQLPPGFTIRDGVIYDGNGTAAVIEHRTNTATTGNPGNTGGTNAGCAQPGTTKPGAAQPAKPNDLFGMISGIVGGALDLGSGVTQASLCYAAQTTQAVVGPGGLLQLRTGSVR